VRILFGQHLGGSIMLVLTRRIGQRIVIGEDIVVTVLEVSPTGVRLGFEAPKIVEIMREEISAKHLNRPERKTGT